MTLAWSRHQYAEIVRNQKVETWLACHRHAFEWFNGVPRTIADRQPQVRDHPRLLLRARGAALLWRSSRWATFLIDPCPVRDPRKKGRVEAGVKYVKSSFVPLREFHSLAHANEQLPTWVMGEAGNRIHGSTRARPLTLFTATEQAMLQPLPAIAPECPAWAKAKLHGNCHVQFEYCYYSAPFALIGQELWLEIGPSALRIYRDHELVAVHPRLFKPGSRSTVDEHLPPDAQAFLMRDPQWCLAQAEAVGPACRAVVESLFGNRVLDHLRAAQGLLGLGESFGRTRLEAACARALNFGAPDLSHRQADSQGGLRPTARAGRVPRTRSALSRRRALRRRPRRSAALATTPTATSFHPVVQRHHRRFNMNPMPSLEPMLKQLRLSGILDSLEARNRQAIEAKLAYTDFLALLIQDEVARRDQRQFDQRCARRRSAPTRPWSASTSATTPPSIAPRSPISPPAASSPRRPRF